MGVAPGAAPPPAVPVNVTVSAPPPPVRKWSLEWPEDSSPETLLDWGMTIRAHLVDKDKVFAALVWGRFIQAWTDIPAADHTDGNDLDVYLSKGLLSGSLPDWAAPLVRNSLQRWHGIAAVQAVCRQVFVRTGLSDKELKRRVSYPEAELRQGNVTLRLASWKSDLSVAVDVRKFAVDEHDRKEAMKDMVEGLKAFQPTLEQYENMPAGYTSDQLFDRLTAVADGIKSAAPTAARKKKKAMSAVRGGGRGRSREDRAAAAVAAVSKAMHKATGFPKPKPKSKRGNALCKYFRDDGNCRFGDKCIFSHGDAGRAGNSVFDENAFGVLADLSDSTERDQMVAAALRFWDGDNRGPVFHTYLTVVAQAVQRNRTVTRARMRLLLDDLACITAGAGPSTVAQAYPAQTDRLAPLTQSPTIVDESIPGQNKKKSRARGRRSRVRRPRATRASSSSSSSAAATAAATAAAPACDGDGDGEDLWSWTGDGDCHFAGALADTGASGDFIGGDDWSGAENVHTIPIFDVHTGHGTTSVNECGDLPFTGGLMTAAPHLQHCPESLLSVGDTYRIHGCGYTHDPGNTAARFSS